ncbi:3-oxo-tetronate kinase [Modestobacter sp. URMC 112]
MTSSLPAPLLGCIADDFTGATDVAAGLRRAGLRVVLHFGTPEPEQTVPACDAVVVALKSRTIPAAEAVEQSLTVQRWLTGLGIPRLYFKYCSTFDSTDAGNIGPVTDALLEAVGGDVTVICPATPEHGRTVYQGHLFVGSTLLSESSMAQHPLTPMTDPDLVQVLSRQTPHRVGLLPLQALRGGTRAAQGAMLQLAADGVRHVVTDVADDADLGTLAPAVAELPLLTGGAGLARAVGAVLRRGVAPVDGGPAAMPAGPAVILAGSCSAATLEQVAQARAVFPAYRLDPAATPDEDVLLAKARAWLEENVGHGSVLLYSSAPAAERAAGLAAMGPGIAEVLERTLGALAGAAVHLGVRRVVVAGGETSGAVVTALGVRSVVVHGEEDPGVPWCTTTTEPQLSLLLKSGNFGRPDLLVRAVGGATR